MLEADDHRAAEGLGGPQHRNGHDHGQALHQQHLALVRIDRQIRHGETGEAPVCQTGGQHQAAAEIVPVAGGDAIAARMGGHVEHQGFHIFGPQPGQRRPVGAQQGQRVDDAVLLAPGRAADLRPKGDFGQLFFQLAAFDHGPPVFAQSFAQFDDIVGALLKIVLAEHRNQPAREVHGHMQAGDILQLPDQLRKEPRGHEAPAGVFRQMQEFGLAPDQPHIGARGHVGTGGRVQHRGLAAFSGQSEGQGRAGNAAAHDDDVAFSGFS